jgi:PelA/Pel-15E family pectate lyase
MFKLLPFSLVLFVAPVRLCVPVHADSPAANLMKKDDPWFNSEHGRTALENILSWQTRHGDWPKNMDTTSKPFSGDRQQPAGTFDNGATTGELRVLARAFRATGDARYKKAFLLGFDHILAAQYPNGGWPQFFPLSKKYHRHITFNDGTMIHLMEFLRDAINGKDFELLDADRRSAAANSIEQGIECIIKCQVVVDGVRTVWCAQHDAETFVPVQARSYEVASLSGAESAGILKFLMSLDKPTQQIVRAVKAGVAWFDAVKIDGYRYRRSKTDTALTKDTTAPPLWARFYEIKSNRPIFCDRDGEVKYDIEEIGSERRGGYTWYGTWGSNVLNTYNNWRQRHERF